MTTTLQTDDPQAPRLPADLPEAQRAASAPAPSLWRRLRESGISRTGLSLVDQFVFALTSFGTGVFIGRVLLEAEFSIYYLAMTIIIVMRNIQSELITAPYSIFRQRHDDQRRLTYAASILTHQLVVSAASILPILALIAAAGVGAVPRAMVPTLTVMLLATPFILFRSFIRSFSFASYRFTAAVVIDGVVALIQLGGLAALYFSDRLTVANAYGVMGLACIAGIATWRFTSPEPFRFSWREVLPDWTKNWAFSRWALTSQLVGTSPPFIVPWLLEAWHGQGATGVYGACFTVIGLSMHFVTAVANYLTPRAAGVYAEEGTRGLTRVLKKTALVYAGVLAAMILVLLVIGDLPVRLIYGTTYGSSGLTCVLLACFTFFISMSVVAGNGLWALNRPEANLWADGCTLLATGVASLTLIPTWGRDGAAASMLIGALVGAAVRGFTLRLALQTADPA